MSSRSETAVPDLGGEHQLAIANAHEVWQELWRAGRGHRWQFVVVFVLGVLSAAAGLIPAVVIGRMVDQVSNGTATTHSIWLATVVMVLGVVVGAVGTAITLVLAARAYHEILASLRENLLKRALILPQSVVEEAGTGDLIARSSDDVSVIAEVAPLIIRALTTVAFTIIVTLIGMAALSWYYAVVMLALIPVYVLTLKWYLAVGPRAYLRERTAMSGRAQQIVESQRGYPTVLGFGLGQQRHESVLRASWKVAIESLRANTVGVIFSSRLNLAEYLGMSAILLVGFWLIDAGVSTIGAATAAMLLFLRLFGPIGILMVSFDDIQSALVSLSRIVGVIQMAAEPDPHGDHESSSGDSPNDIAVYLDDVSFSYGERLVLHDINLVVARGEQIGIVGASGAGKTTLARVVAGIGDPATGTVHRPAETALISQEVHIFSGTLRENVNLAAPNAGDGEILDALRRTGVSELINRLPDGLDTRVGAGAYELTAAQAQQIALARVVLSDPALAILDEATAEAGSADAEVLDRAATAALRGRTALVIAHRLSQAATCDRIAVIEHGTITEFGSHAELMNNGQTYAKLWRTWSSGRNRNNAGPFLEM